LWARPWEPIQKALLRRGGVCENRQTSGSATRVCGERGSRIREKSSLWAGKNRSVENLPASPTCKYGLGFRETPAIGKGPSSLTLCVRGGGCCAPARDAETVLEGLTRTVKKKNLLLSSMPEKEGSSPGSPGPGNGSQPREVRRA